MKLRWDDFSDKLTSSTLLPVFLVWAVLCGVALILVYAFFPRDGSGPGGIQQATKKVGDVSSSYIGNLNDLWFNDKGALVGMRLQGTRLEVYIWANPYNLQQFEKKDIDIRKLIDATPLYSSPPTDAIQFRYAVRRDASAVAISVDKFVAIQSLETSAISPSFQVQDSAISWIGYTNDRLILLYTNGTLESREPTSLTFRSSQPTGLENPVGLTINGTMVLAVSSKDNSLRLFDFGKTVDYLDGNTRYTRASQIKSSAFPPVPLSSLVYAISDQGQLAYSAGTAAVLLMPPVAEGSSVPEPAPSELQAPGTVAALAFSGEDLLAAGDFQGIHWLGKSVIPDTPTSVRLFGASTKSIATLSNGTLWAAKLQDAPGTSGASASGNKPPIYTRFWFILLVWAVIAGLPLWPLVLNWLRNRLFPKLKPVKDWVTDAPTTGSTTLALPFPPAELVRACASGECVLYAGRGLSAPAGFPTLQVFVRDLTDWTVVNGFVDEALGRSLRTALSQGEYASVADNLASVLEPHSEQLQAYLREVFIRSATPPPALKPLADIQFSGVMTTNFDRLLESTYSSQQSPVYTLRDSDKLLEGLSKHSFFFLKLYGSLDQPETVMISPAQYEDAVRRNFPFSQFMETLFFSRTLLFVGSSLDGIEAYLRGISFSKQNLRTHYALVAVEDDAWRAKALPLRSRYGIEVLPYTPGEGHANLQSFLSQLASEVQKEVELTKHDQVTAAYLKRLVLTDIGPFEHLEVEFNQSWNILLGDNGSGKSTILKAIAVSILGEDAKGYAGRLVRSGQPRGEISLSTERNTYRTIITPLDGTSRVESIPGRAFEAEGWLAMGFPPLRTVSWARPKSPEAQTKGRPTPSDLLPLIVGDPDPRLDKLKQWIVNLDYWIKDAKSRSEDPSRYQNLLDEFFRVVGDLTLGQKVTFKDVNPQTNEVRITNSDGDLPLESLSQGMTSLIGWVGILLQRMYELYGDDEDPRNRYAMVLMDEIDAHLHPAWQQTLVRRLEKIFPNAQFIATTHSPLIVAGMEPQQILRFARDDDGKLIQLEVDEEMTLGRADQILTGDLFGLQTTFSLNDDLEKDKADYKTLLAKDKRTESEEILFQKLRKSLRTRVPMSGEGPVERRAFDLVRELIKDETDERFDGVNQDLIEKAERLLTEVSKKRQ